MGVQGLHRDVSNSLVIDVKETGGGCGGASRADVWYARTHIAYEVVLDDTRLGVAAVVCVAVDGAWTVAVVIANDHVT